MRVDRQSIAGLPVLRQLTLKRLFLASLLPGLVAVAAVLWLYVEQQRARVEDDLLHTARALSLAVDRDLAGGVQALQALATSPHLAADDLPAFQGQAATLLATQAADNIVLTGPDAVQRLNVKMPLGAQPVLLGSPELVERVVRTGKPAVSDLYFGRMLQSLLVATAVPVFRDGRVAQVLVMSRTTPRLGRLLAEQHLPAGWMGAVLDRGNIFVARTHQPEVWVGKRASALVVEALSRQAEGAVPIVTVEGIPAIAAFSRSGLSGWTVALAVPSTVLYGGLWRSAALLALPVLVLAAAGLALAWLLGAHVTRALGQLAESVRAGLAGRPMPPLPAGTPEEIRRLAAEFTGLLEARQQAEEALRASASELDDLYNQAPCGYHSLGPDGHFLHVNDTELAWLGYRREEVVGRLRFQDLLTPTGQAAFQRTFPAFKEQGWVKDLEFDLVRKDGSLLPVLLSATAVKDEAGNFVMSRSTILDVTELRRHRDFLEETVARRTEELAAAKQAAEVASQAKSSFLANMSHEIRTPLNAIIGHAALLAREESEPRRGARLKGIGEAARHLLSVINDILDIARVEAGRLTLDEEDFELAAVAAPVMDLVREEAGAKGLSLDMDIAPALAGKLRGDPRRLGQVLLNYLGNAVKFTAEGRVSLRAFVAEEGEDGLLARFEVTDTGIGIGPDTVARLFQPFEQADASISRKFGGNGLGLVICRELARLMGGETGVESREGEGSTFWFTARFGQGAVPPAAAPTSPAGDSAEERVSREHAGARILLVEDEPFSREFEQTILAGLGLQVSVAENGRQAVDLAGREAFDLILMDLQMPEMDGLTAARAIRRLPGHHLTPIVAMTANAYDEDRQNCLAAGMNDHVSKPFEMESLFGTMLRWLAEGHRRSTTPGGATTALLP